MEQRVLAVVMVVMRQADVKVTVEVETADIMVQVAVQDTLVVALLTTLVQVTVAQFASYGVKMERVELPPSHQQT